MTVKKPSTREFTCRYCKTRFIGTASGRGNYPRFCSEAHYELNNQAMLDRMRANAEARRKSPTHPRCSVEDCERSGTTKGLCANHYAMHIYHERRAEWINRQGGQCMQCGSTTELQIDHIRREDKKFEAGAVMRLSKARREAELAKCQVLCKPCPHEKSRREENGGRHGTISMYSKHRCRCDVCVTFMRERRRARKAAGPAG